MNFMIQQRIISRNLQVYAYLLKSHFTSGMSIVVLLIWYQITKDSRLFLILEQDGEDSVLHMEV